MKTGTFWFCVWVLLGCQELWGQADSREVNAPDALVTPRERTAEQLAATVGCDRSGSRAMGKTPSPLLVAKACEGGTGQADSRSILNSNHGRSSVINGVEDPLSDRLARELGLSPESGAGPGERSGFDFGSAFPETGNSFDPEPMPKIGFDDSFSTGLSGDGASAAALEAERQARAALGQFGNDYSMGLGVLPNSGTMGRYERLVRELAQRVAELSEVAEDGSP